MTFPRYRWQTAAVDGTVSAQAARLAAALNVHPVVAKLLCLRGFSQPDAAAAFLRGPAEPIDPFALRDMDRAVAAVWSAIVDRRRVLVYGDYDADGLSATALLTAVLREAGAEVHYKVPHRLNDGYGLSIEAVSDAAAAGYGLLVTVDCGITAVAEAEHAAALGLPVVITDHHEPGPVLPAAVAVVNPHRRDCGYPEKTLSGAGVAYKFAQGLARAAPDPHQRRDLEALAEAQLDLVALGTIADVMPMTGENRSFVRRGLHLLSTAPRPGLEALLVEPGGVAATVTEEDISFKIAPRLNAAGRLGRLAPEHGVDLLLAGVDQAGSLAAALIAENRRRQDLEADMTGAAMEQAQACLAAKPDAPVLVLYDADWHVGIVGTVAGRVSEEIGLPVALLARDGDVWRGSGRGPEGSDWPAWLAACSDWLVQHGGHRQAAGFAVRDGNVEPFAAALAEAVGAAGEVAGAPPLMIDLWLDSSDLTLALARDLRHLAPFGPGNPEPVFGWRKARVAGARQVGQKRNHLKLRLQGSGRRGSVDAIGFKLVSDAAAIPAQGDAIDIAFCLRINEWQGRTTVDLQVQDYAPVQRAASVVAETRPTDGWRLPPQTLDDRGWPAPLAGQMAARLWELPLAAGTRLSPVGVVVDRRGTEPVDGRVSESQAVWVCGTLEQKIAMASTLPQATAVWPDALSAGSPPVNAETAGAAGDQEGAARHWVVAFGALTALPARAGTKPAVLLAPPPTWDTWLHVSAGRAVELAFGPAEAVRQQEALTAYAPDRDALAECFTLLRDALSPRADIREADWDRLIKIRPAATWRAAVTVFRELGFIVPDAGAMRWRPPVRRTDLADSPTYRARRMLVEESKRLSEYFLTVAAPELQAVTAAGSHPLAGAG